MVVAGRCYKLQTRFLRNRLPGQVAEAHLRRRKSKDTGIRSILVITETVRRCYSKAVCGIWLEG
jgi:hypothetical protein